MNRKRFFFFFLGHGRRLSRKMHAATILYIIAPETLRVSHLQDFV